MAPHPDNCPGDIGVCSFCGGTDADGRRLIQGPLVAICSECVGICVDQLKSWPEEPVGTIQKLEAEIAILKKESQEVLIVLTDIGYPHHIECVRARAPQFERVEERCVVRPVLRIPNFVVEDCPHCGDRQVTLKPIYEYTGSYNKLMGYHGYCNGCKQKGPANIDPEVALQQFLGGKLEEN